MASVFTETFIQARITAITAIITSYETAITSLSSGTLKSYTINTGQTTESVTKRDLTRISTELDSWVRRLEYWDTMLNGGGTILARGC